MIVVLHPNLGFTEDNQNTETPVRLGDGYLMAGRVKESDRKTYSITGLLQTEDELAAVITQFESLVGVKFQWQPIAGVAMRNFWCPEWTVTPLGKDWRGYKWEISAKFEEAR